jgi:hypothetical protein
VIKVILMISKIAGKNNGQHYFEFYKKIKWFPILQIICAIPSTVNRVFSIFDERPVGVLNIMQAFLGASYGICYLIIFLSLPSVNNAIKQLYKRGFGKSEQNQSLLIDTSLNGS